MLGLEFQLKDTEKELANNHTDDHLRRVCELKFQLNELHIKKVEYALFRMKSNL